MKRPTVSKPRRYVYAALILLIIGNYAGLLLVWQRQQTDIRSLNDQVKQIYADRAATQGPVYSDVTISPPQQAVYFPPARLELPDSALAESLVYTYEGDHTVPGLKKVFPATLSVSTHDLAANAASTTQQFDCTEVVYADFTTPSYPVNPMWKAAASVRLADGRTMHVYYAPAVPGCQTAWRLHNIDSKAIAAVFKAAASY